MVRGLSAWLCFHQFGFLLDEEEMMQLLNIKYMEAGWNLISFKFVE